MPDNCCVDGCANVRSRQLDIGFFRIPAIPKKASKPEIKELLSTRRNAWLMAIGRTDVSNPKHWKVCGKHFISGVAAKSHDTTNPDWVPNKNMRSLRKRMHQPKRRYRKFQHETNRTKKPFVTALTPIESEYETYDRLEIVEPASVTRIKCGEIFHDNSGYVWFACSYCNLMEFTAVEDYLTHINTNHLIKVEIETDENNEHCSEFIDVQPHEKTLNDLPEIKVSPPYKNDSITHQIQEACSDWTTFDIDAEFEGAIHQIYEPSVPKFCVDVSSPSRALPKQKQPRNELSPTSSKFHIEIGGNQLKFVETGSSLNFNKFKSSSTNKLPNSNVVEDQSVCQYCNKSFRSSFMLHTHITKCHNDEKPCYCTNHGGASEQTSTNTS